MDIFQLSERDICTKFITPAIQQAGWEQSQFREEANLTDCPVMVRGKLAACVRNPEAHGGPTRADYVLYGRSDDEIPDDPPTCPPDTDGERAPCSKFVIDGVESRIAVERSQYPDRTRAPALG